MKTIISVLVLLSVSSAFAVNEKHVLRCKNKDATHKLDLFKQKNGQFRARSEQIANYKTGEIRQTIHTLDLLGNANLEYQHGVFAYLPSTLVFIAKAEIGTAFLVAKNKQNKLIANLGTARGGGDLVCTKGREFDVLEKELEAAVSVPRNEYFDYRDTNLALNCQSERGPFKIRAFSSGHAKSDIQFHDGDKTFQDKSFSANNFRVIEDQIMYYDSGIQSSGIFILNRVPMMKDGRIFYTAQVNYNKKYFTAVCEEKWALKSNILIPAKQYGELPRSFPQNPGTVADLDPSKCSMEAANEIVDRYRPLIDRMGGYDFLALFKSDPKNPLGPDCATYNIGFGGNQEAAQKYKSVIGDSLEGLLIVYGE